MLPLEVIRKSVPAVLDAKVCEEPVNPLKEVIPPPPLPQLRPVDVNNPEETSTQPLARP